MKKKARGSLGHFPGALPKDGKDVTRHDMTWCVDQERETLLKSVDCSNYDYT